MVKGLATRNSGSGRFGWFGCSGYCIAVWLMLLLPPPGATGELMFEGKFVQGGLVQGRAVPGARIMMDGKPVRVSSEGFFLIGFGRDAPTTSRLIIHWSQEKTEERVLKVAKRQYEIQRIDGLPERTVTPDKKDLERIKKEVALVKEARKRDDPRMDFAAGFIWPAIGRISGVYGSQRILNGKPRRPHFGLDIAAPVGTPIVAPAAGLVTLVHPDMFFSGGTLILDHGHGLSSGFIHLNRILVKDGERVEQGQLIAEIGATGRATGAHLDWRINLFEQRLDPALLVPPMDEISKR